MSRNVERTSPSLLRGVKEGDKAAWGEFVTLYEPLLIRYVRKKGPGEDDARDIVQNIFITLVRKMPAFTLDHGKGRFRTWLWQVTHNAVVDWSRAKTRAKKLEAELQAGYEEGRQEPDEEWDTEFQKRVLEYAIEKVKQDTNPQTWACFERHLLKGHPGAAVGAELGMPANTVYVYAARVMARVRKQCEAYQEEFASE
jgi:RNA polymerase sigma-70 factor, ECF subfamily